MEFSGAIVLLAKCASRGALAPTLITTRWSINSVTLHRGLIRVCDFENQRCCAVIRCVPVACIVDVNVDVDLSGGCPCLRAARHQSFVLSKSTLLSASCYVSPERHSCSCCCRLQCIDAKVRAVPNRVPQCVRCFYEGHRRAGPVPACSKTGTSSSFLTLFSSLLPRIMGCVGRMLSCG